MRRLSVTVPALLLVLGGLSACSDDDDPAQDLARQWAAALSTPATAKDSANPFAKLTFTDSTPEAAWEEYRAITAGMDGITPTVTVGDVAESKGSRTVRTTWSWPVVDGADPWVYDTTTELSAGAGAEEPWEIVWAPADVHGSLAEGDVLDAVTQPADRGDIIGASGVLVTERPVVRVGVDRVRIDAERAPEAARELAELVGIDVDPYVTAVSAAGQRAFVEAITYRADDIPPAVEKGLGAIDGVLQTASKLALAPTREFAAPILGRVGPVTAEMVENDPQAYQSGDVAGLSGLQARYDEQLRGRDGRIVYAVPADDEAKRTALYEREAQAGEPLALTLDEPLQKLAEEVLAGVEPSAAIVAIRPSDGAVLAAANGAGTGGANHATFGRFAPGSTFKIVTSLALLRAGLTPGTNVECTPEVTVDGKRFKNYSDYPSGAIGTISLGAAIANSCNTALIDARDRIGDGDLAAAAASLGLGIDHDLGFPAYLGEVPAPASQTEAAASLIGQGRVQASPMVMAAVMASVQAGHTVVPRLVDQVSTTVPAAAKPLTAAETTDLQAMLRGVVTDGSGRGLADVPGPPVRAKTGTAEYADGDTIRTHAWMVAGQGDLAVAVFVHDGESGSGTAGPLLERFLRGAR